MMLSALLLMLTNGAAVTETSAIAEPNPRAMSRSEISAFNDTVARDHPYYIVCRKLEVTGSLVKKDRVCMTNAEWKEASRIGNSEAREWTDHTRSSTSVTGN